MVRFAGFFSVAACAILSSATIAFTQIDDDGVSGAQSGQSTITIQDDSEEAGNNQLPEPLESDATSTQSSVVEQNIDDSGDDEEHKTVAVKSDLLAAGYARKGTGTALTAIGGIFIGGFFVYTVLFMTDNRTFGIPLGSSTSGYYRTEYFLNPGIFAIPIGAPCLALGIVNLIKGKNMISDAMGNNDDDDDEEDEDEDEDESAAPFKIVPYVSCQPKVNGYGAGFVATF